MPETAEATADQPQELNINTALRGLSLETETKAADTTSQPSAAKEEVKEEKPETEVQPEGEQAEAAAEGESDQSVEDWLQDLTQRQIAQYQQRYPTAWAAVSDPNQPEDLRQMLKDRINQDREVERLKGLTEAEAEVEPTDEEAAEAAKSTAPPEVQQEQARAEHYKQVEQALTLVDSKSIGQLGTDVLQALSGYDLSKANDASLPEETRKEIKAILAAAPRVGQVLAKGALDLVLTIVPQLVQKGLPDYIEQVYPGSQYAYEVQRNANLWQQIKKSDDNGTKPYAALPDRLSDEWVGGATSALEGLGFTPEQFDVMLLNDPKTGRPYAAEKQVQMKYTVLARAMAGKKVNPAVLAEAYDNGKKAAGKAGQQRAAGKALGAGKSANAGGGGDDGFKAAILDYNRSQKS